MNDNGYENLYEGYRYDESLHFRDYWWKEYIHQEIISTKNYNAIKLINTNAKAWNYWRSINPRAKIILAGSDLSYANMSFYNLDGIDLSSSYMRGSLFDKTNFEKVVMICSVFTESYFFDCAAKYSDFSLARLTRVKLFSVDFTCSYLNGCIFFQTKLEDSNFNGANLQGADLRLASISFSSFINADLRNARFDNTRFLGCDLRGAKFSSNVEKVTLNPTDSNDFILGSVEKKALRHNGQALEDNIFVFPGFGANTKTSSDVIDSRKLNLDSNLIHRIRADSDMASSLIGSIFDESNPILEQSDIENEIAEPCSIKSNKKYQEFLQKVSCRRFWVRLDLSSIATNLGLMLDGTLEMLNEAAFDLCDEPLTHGEDPIEIDVEVLEQLLL